MAQVSFYKMQNSALSSFPIKEGQIIYVTDSKRLYLDNAANSRIEMTSYNLTQDSNNNHILIFTKPDGTTVSYTMPDTLYNGGDHIIIDENNNIDLDEQTTDRIYGVATKEGSGETVSLVDTREAKMKVGLKGNTSQETTTGKNLLGVKTNLKKTTTNGITFTPVFNSSNLLEYIEVSGTCTAATTYTISNSVSLTADSYLLSGCPSGGGANTYGLELRGGAFPKDVGSGRSFTLTNDFTFWDCRITIEKGATLSALKFYPMLVQGTTATDYEPYTGGQPSPNPSYPQPIQVVSGDNTIVSTGVNLLTYPYVDTPNSPKTTNGLTWTDNGDGTISVSGTATGYSDFVLFNTNKKLMVQPNTTYNLSGIPSTAYLVFDLSEFDSDNALIVVHNNIRNSSFTTSPNARWLQIIAKRSSNNQATDTIIKPQLELGSQASTFEPYTGTSYQVNLGNIKLCKIGDYQDKFFKAINGNTIYDSLDSTIKNTLDYGEWYLEKNIGKVVLDGSESGWTKNPSITTTNGYSNNALFPYRVSNSGIYCNYLKQVLSLSGNKTGIYNATNCNFLLEGTDYDTEIKFKNWLSTYTPIVYYQMSTPTYTKIEGTLASQLNAIEYAMSYNGQTNITQVNNDKPFIIDASAIAGLSLNSLEEEINRMDYISQSEKAAPNGVAELDDHGIILSSQLPSYVDDVLEFADMASFPAQGENGKIYVALDTNLTYRWSGSAYVEISKSLALGETSSTAYRGDRGAAAYKHAVTNKGSAFASNLYKITTNSEGHVTAATAAVKSDIINLGIPGTASNGVKINETDIQLDDNVNNLLYGNEEVIATDVENASLNNTLQGKLNIELKGNTYQETTSISGGDEYDSPSPDHPQPIQVVSGDNEVVVCGKNLLDVNNNLISSIQGLSFVANNNGSFSYSGTLESHTWVNFMNNVGTFIKAGEYTISISNSLNFNLVWYFQYEDGTNNTFSITSGDTSRTITLQKNVVRHRVGFTFMTIGTTYNGTLKIMLEKGSIATSYQPYQEQKYPINLGVENLFDKNNANVLNAYLSGYKILGYATNQTIYIPIIGGTTYTVTKKVGVTNLSLAYTTTTPTIEGETLGTITATSKTYTTTSPINATFLCVFVRKDSDSDYTLEEILEGLEIVKGDKAQQVSDNPIELCNIPNTNYQDKFFKAINGNTIYDNLDSTIKNTLDYGKWYLEKNIGKAVLDGSENWVYPTQIGSSTYYRYENQNFRNNDCMVHSQYLSDNFKYNGTTGQVEQNVITNTSGANTNRLWITINTSLTSGTTENDFKIWLSTHNTNIYYVLETPTYTKIEGTLASQLEDVWRANTYDNQTNVSQVNNDLPFILDVSAPTYTINGMNKEYAHKEDAINKVTSISDSSTDTQYPSAKCVYDLVGNVETILETLDIGNGVS